MGMHRVVRKIKVSSLSERDTVKVCVQKVSSGWDILPEDSRLSHVRGRFGVALDDVVRLMRGALSEEQLAQMRNAPDVNWMNPCGVKLHVLLTVKRVRRVLGGEFRRDYGVARAVAKPEKQKHSKPWMKGAGYIPRSQRVHNHVSKAEAAAEQLTALLGM